MQQWNQYDQYDDISIYFSQIANCIQAKALNCSRLVCYYWIWIHAKLTDNILNSTHRSYLNPSNKFWQCVLLTIYHFKT